MRKTLTDKGVSALKPRPNRYAYPDPELAGHYVRVTANGAKSFATVTRSPDGKQIWTTLGATDRMSIATAREMAREAITRVRAGLSAFEARGETFGNVVANWLTRHVERNGLRSRKEIERVLSRHLLPQWRDREIAAIKRSNITVMLDCVEDTSGARQADACLTILSSLMRWHARRVDDFHLPIIAGMRRQPAHSLARARILDDGEIRAVWEAAESNGTYGALIKFALLTAQRREKVSTLRWDDISDAGEWTIPKAPREKDTGGTLLLPPVALDIVQAQPRIATNPFVFAGRGDRPISGFSKLKERFDAKLAGVEPWRFHDLRRTARSLMSRCGVSPEHSERVLGHVTGSAVANVYDRHSYRDEKGDALARLAAVIDSIVNPRENVLPLAKQPKRRMPL